RRQDRAPAACGDDASTAAPERPSHRPCHTVADRHGRGNRNPPPRPPCGRRRACVVHLAFFFSVAPALRAGQLICVMPFRAVASRRNSRVFTTSPLICLPIFFHRKAEAALG